jgi:hypothetical protein
MISGSSTSSLSAGSGVITVDVISVTATVFSVWATVCSGATFVFATVGLFLKYWGGIINWSAFFFLHQK